MSTKLTYSEISEVIRTVPTEGMQAHYVVGAMTQMLAEAISRMSKKDQAAFMFQIEWLKGRTAEINPGY